MATSISSLLSLSLIFSCVTTMHSAEPTMKPIVNLVNQVCSKTQKNPSFCLQALKSNPSSTTADLRGLAKISIDMALARAQKTYAMHRSLVKQVTNPQLKEWYSSCYGNYDGAISDIKAAKMCLGSSDYASLNIQASAAQSSVVDCEDNFKTPPADPS